MNFAKLFENFDGRNRDIEKEVQLMNYVDEFRNAVHNGIGSTVLDGKYVYESLEQGRYQMPYCHFK